MRFLVVLLLGGAVLAAEPAAKPEAVRYEPAAKLKVFPEPPLQFERPGLATPAQHQQIREKLYRPLLQQSRLPVAAVVVEFPANDKTTYLVTVLYHGGGSVGAALLWKDGNVKPGDVASLLPPEPDEHH